MEANGLTGRFGLTGPARLSDGPVARGRQGSVWRLDTDDAAWAVKTTFDRVSEDDVRLSTRLQEAAYDAGVPTPGVRRTTDGDVFADLGDEQARLYAWVDLRPPDTRLDPAQVGAVVAGLHQILVPAGETTLDAWHTEPVGAPAWDALVAELTAAGAPFAGQLAAQRDELVELESWLAPPRSVRLCHRDLWADNLRSTADGAPCVIDWENAGPADPAQELACVLFEFGRPDRARARTLLEAYRTAGGPATLDGRGDLSMLIAQLGHITEIAARDWLVPNARSPQRADAEAWIAECLDDPHSPEVLDALLDVARGRV